MMILRSSSSSPFARKVRIAVHLLGLAGEIRIENTDTMDPKDSVRRQNPLGKIPVLMLEDGTALYDSRVIVEFLDGVSPISRLIPEDKRDRLAVRRWEALADGVLDAGLLVRYESLRDKKEQSKAWVDKQLARMHRAMAQMESELGERPWCHGERYSLADIAVGCCLGWVDFRRPADIDWRAEHANLVRFYERLMERAAFADTAPKA